MTQYDIEKIILKPTWKETLLELITHERLDPWNIEITVLADSFLKRIKEMKTLELHIPANIILASAILLKYKSDILRIEDDVEEEPAVYEEAEYEEIPGLELVSRIPPKRQISVDELIKEMEHVLERYDNKKILKPEKIEEVLTLPAPQFDIEERMEHVFECIKQNLDKEGWTTFSELLETKKVDEIIYTLLSLLHLWQKRLIDLKQDTFFGEIFIRIDLLKENINYNTNNKG